MQIENDNKISIIDDIEIDYKKLNNDCKAKHTEAKKGIEDGLNLLLNLKNINPNQIEFELKKSVDKLLFPIQIASNQKIKRIFVSCLDVIKKLLSYNLFTQRHSKDIINILNNFLNNSSEEFVQIKIIETLIPLVDEKIFSISEDLANIIFNMCLKFYAMKNQSFKNPLNSVLTQLTKTVFGFLDATLRPSIIRKKTKILEEKKMKNSDKKIINNNININNNEISEVKEIKKEENNVPRNLFSDEIEEDNSDNNSNKNENIETNNKEIEDKNNESNIENNKEIENKNNDSNNEIKENNEDNNTKINEIITVLPEEIDLTEYEDTDIYSCSYYLFNSVCDLIEGKKNPIIYVTLYSKSMGMELLTLMLTITKDLFIYLPNFISRIKENIIQSLTKNFNSAYDYITCVKLCRLTYQINLNLQFGYDLIQNYIKYAELNSLTWQKNLGIESISQILSSPDLLFNLYIYNEHKLYESIFSTLNKITYVNVLNLTTKNNKNSEIELKKIIEERYFDDKVLFYEGEVYPNPIVTNEIIFIEILFCYYNLFITLKKISEHEKEDIIEIGEKNINPLNLFDIIHYKQNDLLNSILALSQVSTNEDVLNKFMEIFKNAIIIFGNLNFVDLRDLYLKELDNLIHIPNDDDNNKVSDNIFLEEKAMLTIFDIFNDNIEKLDGDGFSLLLNSIQKINFKIIKSENNLLIKPNEEFELEVYIRYIEQNLKKYTNFSITEDGKSIIKDNLGINFETKIEEEKEENEEEKKEIPKEDNNNSYGLFSTLKYVFGFSKKKTTNDNVINQATLLQQKEIFKKLSEKINCLFIENSNEYSDKVLTNIMDGLIENTKKLCDIPSDNQMYFLHFNLSRFLEIVIVNYKRITLVNPKFIEIIELISSKQIKNVSHYSIDVLTISIMMLLNLIKDDNFFSQKDLFSSLLLITSKNLSQDISLNIIYDINELLLNSSKLLNNEGWNSIFEIFKKQIIYSDEAQTENSFMLLEQIFKNNFEELTPDNIIYINDLLEGFIIYKKNENISKMALKMIEYLCNLCEKFSPFIYISNNNFDNPEIKLTNYQKDFFKFKYDTIEKRKKFFDDLWKDIFFKIINLACDERTTIRQLVIETYQNIFIKRCSLISPETSLYILNSDFFEVFNKTYEIYNDKMKYKRKIKQLKIEKKEKEEKKLNEEKTIKFGEYQIGQLILPEKKTEKKEEDDNKNKEKSEESEWEDTLQFSIKSISFIISSFLKTNPNLGFQFFENQIFSPLSQKFSEAMKFISPDIIIEMLNCILTIEESYPELFYKYFNLFWCVYYEMSNFISNNYFYENFSDLAFESKMTSKILDNLRKLYLKKEFIEVTLSSENFNNLLIIIRALINSVYYTQKNLNNDPPYNLLLDESNVFEFMKEIQKIIINDENNLMSYAKFLSSYLKIDLNNLHSEALCRKSLDMFLYLFTDQFLPFNIYKNYLPIFITNCKDIISLRNKIDYVTSLLEIRERYSQLKKKKSANYGNSFSNNFSSIIGNNTQDLNNQNQINTFPEISIIQLWHYSSEILIKILTFVISNNNKNKNLNKNNIENIWECLIESYEIIFKQSENGYKTIPKNILDELIKSCQEMEISIINFIVNTLLPNSLYIKKTMQIQLLNLLDMGSNFDYSNQNTSSSTSSLQSSISKVCISNLFELCKFKTEDNLKKEINEKNFDPSDYVKIKVKIAKMCTPILIKRCKETLKKFLDDEIKSGSMPLSRSRLEDIKFVLEKLKLLEIYPDYIYIDEKEIEEKNQKEKDMMDFILMKKKSHLISLLPLLSEFITTKEIEVKIIVKEIFRIISSELGIKN